MAYQHGVRVLEEATGITAPITGTAGLQVVFGTAPINLAADPYAVTNVPIIAYTYKEAVEKLGFSYDFESYTLCQSIYASFKLVGVAPVVFINVLDPNTHRKSNAETDVTVENLTATVKTLGILRDTVVVKSGSETLRVGEDYILTFDDDGYLVITLTTSGSGAAATTLNVTSTSIDPSAVTAANIVGTYNASTGVESGMEVLRQVYPKLGMTPGLLLAPGWSHKADVAVTLQAKCEEINGYFRCECVIDVDSTSDGARVYSSVKAQKEADGISSEHAVALWPCVKSGSYRLWYSAVFAALTAYTDAANDDVPNLSPSNKSIPITGTCLSDGTEVSLDQVQGNSLNGQGIITAINVNGWRSWGNNSAAYPATTDPKDRWWCCRRFFSWWGNSFILTYFQKVDDPMNRVLIENVVDSENIRGGAYVSSGKAARIEIEFTEADNPTTDTLNGKMTFRQHLSPYTPAEDIVDILEFDPEALTAALTGGE